MNQPEIIYKFRDWDNAIHRSILLYNELYFASPKDFNDPFDCRITKNYSLLDTPEKKSKYVDSIMISSFPHWSKINKTPEEMIKEMERRLEDLPTLQKEFDELSSRENDLHYGVICFSSIWNSILMWSHYAKSHQGICVGFYEEKLRNLGLQYVKGGLVMYDSKFPEIDPLNSSGIEELFLTTHFKSLEWKYEVEYRISILNYPDPLSNNQRLLNFPTELFAEVILGLNIDPLNKREVVQICKEKKIPVYQAIKLPQQFNFSCAPVE